MINFYQSGTTVRLRKSLSSGYVKPFSYIENQPHSLTLSSVFYQITQFQFIQSLKIARVSSRFPPTKNCNTQRLSAASVVGTVKKLPQQTLPFFHDHPSARAMTEQRTQKKLPISGEL
jgi:hypothetical protein